CRRDGVSEATPLEAGSHTGEGARNARHSQSCARCSAHIAIGVAVADFEYLDLLDPTGGAELDGVALIRFGPSASGWRAPADLSAGEIGFVDADNRDRSFGPILGGVGDRRAKEHLIEPRLLSRVDHFGAFQPLRQKADATIDLAEAALSVDVVAVFGTVPVTSRPGHGLYHFGAFHPQQLAQFVLHLAVTPRGHVILKAGWNGWQSVG